MDYRRSDNFDFNFPSWIQRDEIDRIKFHYQRLYSTYGDGPTYETSLSVLGHKLRIPRTSGRVAEFTFDELCAEGLGEPLGAADYLALADHFDVIIIRYDLSLFLTMTHNDTDYYDSFSEMFLELIYF